jgi:hypothetical protein
MIELFRRAGSAQGAAIQEKLRELVVAHRIVTVDTDQPSPLNGTPLPAIVDDGRVISGQAELEAYLGELGKEVERWRRFQMDACYIDDNGETC